MLVISVPLDGSPVVVVIVVGVWAAAVVVGSAGG